MSTRDVTVLGYALVLLTALCYELLMRARSTGGTVGDVLTAAMRVRTGRLIVLLWWWWIGWHFLARNSG
jgi:hypothetical protein